MLGKLRLARMSVLAAVLLLAAMAQAHRVQAEEAVDLLLVLAADISRSVDEPKFRLQRQGYAAALRDPRVLKAINSGPQGRVAICFVEWSGSTAQTVVVDWASIGTATEADVFAGKVLEAPRAFMERTSISGAIDFSLAQLGRSPFTSERRTIDVSGDGTNNSGRDVVTARDAALAAGVTINGLVILSEVPLATNPSHTHPPGGLMSYYERNVIGGPGSFVLAAESFQSFRESIISKLIKEIASLSQIYR
jgi:hypothetical protein